MEPQTTGFIIPVNEGNDYYKSMKNSGFLKNPTIQFSVFDSDGNGKLDKKEAETARANGFNWAKEGQTQDEYLEAKKNFVQDLFNKAEKDLPKSLDEIFKKFGKTNNYYIY